MKILYVGVLRPGSTSLMRMQALERLGHEVVPLDTPEDPSNSLLSRVRRRLEVHARVRRDAARADARLQESGKATHDIVWLDKQLTVRAETLRGLKAAQPNRLIVGFSPDDMMNPMNQTRRFLRSLPFYDVYFTTKSFGVTELQARGVHRALFIGNGYDDQIHRPHPVTAGEAAELGADVGFIGTYEKDRAGQINFLAEHSIPVTIFGSGWKYPMHKNVRIKGRPLIGESFAKSVNATRINLCFLRKANRDRQTTRSVGDPRLRRFHAG